VRAAASDFLGLFRVQKFAAISVSPEQIALLQQVAESGLTPGNMTLLEEPSEPRPVDTLDEAASATALSSVRTLTGLGQPEAILVADGGCGQFELDLESARAILTAVGADPTLLPDSLADSTISIAVSSSVEQRWDDGTFLVKMESPEVSYPAELDPALLGAAMLQVLGLSPAEANRLSQQIDWTSTLLLPIPTDFASFNEVTVDGVSGLYLQSMEGSSGALVWQKAGMIHLLFSPRAQNELLDLVNTLR
jgi:hypothetical protein